MTGRGARKRGRPPKTPNERGSKFSYQLLKKPKYLTKGHESQFSTPSASRASSPPESDGSRRSLSRPTKPRPTRGRGRRSGYSQPSQTSFSLRKGYESEYHYGSDFGDSTDKSDVDDDPLLMSPTEEESVDDNESDSVFSECSFSQGGLNRHSRPPSPDPIWLQDREFAALVLPKSSEDLLISNKLALQALTIYEVLRRFRHLVRLSPFRIEDFCASLICEEQSALFIEVHIMLLKAILREEDMQATHFGPLDQKDSVNISLFLIDNITWPEVLRSYVESDPLFNRSVYNILQSKQYPYSGVEERLTVLQFLSDQLLNTTAVRDVMLQEGPIHYDDHCRVCHRLGDLLCCETCPAVFHLECVDPPLVDVPTEDWQCNLCQSHRITGVVDCISLQEKQGVLIRHEQLGFDRHGRKYWFVARRIFVEDQNNAETWYYSTATQLELLLSVLDCNDLESSLCKELFDKREEIIRQMKITDKLTNENKFNKKSYFDFENEKNSKILDNSMKEENECVDNNDEFNSELMVTRQKLSQLNNGTLYFKLGMENSFKNYVNQYTINPIALNKPQRNEERDKRRHLSHKFSLTTASEFKWLGNSNGTATTIINTLRQTLINFDQSIAAPFMNTNWNYIRKTWVTAVANSTKPSDFSYVLLLLEACFKSVIFANVWHEQLGHIRFNRTTSAEREERKKIEKREKRERDDEEERNRLAFNYVKYSLGLKHQVWKQKGEEYRIHGQWGWMWMSYFRPAQRNRRSQKRLTASKINVHIMYKKDSKIITVDPRTYNFLRQCERSAKLGLNFGYIDDFKHIKIIEFTETNNINTIDVSKSLTANGRLLFPKIARKSKLDDLLSKRLLLKEAEEQYMSSTNESSHINLTSSKQISNNRQSVLEKQILRLVEQKQNSQSNSVNLELVNTLAKKIQSVRFQFSQLNKFAKQYRCYTKDCNTNSNAVSQITQNTCYSPLCLQKAKAKKELLLLLRKAHTAGNGSKETVAAILGAVKKPSILEQKLMEGKKEANITIDDFEEKQIEDFPIDLKQDFQNALENNIEFEEQLYTSNFSKLSFKQEIWEKQQGDIFNTDIQPCGSIKKTELLTSDTDNYIDNLDVCSTIEIESTDAISNAFDTDSAMHKKKKQKLRTRNNNPKEVVQNQVTEQNVCRQNRRFPLHPPRIVKREDNIKIEKEIGPDGSERIYSASSTREKIYLVREFKNLKDRQPAAMDIISKYPIISNFYTHNLQKSLLVLPKYELHKLGRSGGKLQVNGYHHLAKNNTSVWPYPCSRPLFKTCWLYRTTNAPTIAAIALQLRILYCCLRWDDMIAKPQSQDGKYQITTETEIVTQELLKLKHFGKFSEKTQYLRRKVVIPLELPKTIREVTSIRSGLRKRKRAESPQQTEPQVSEEWVEEEKLELWEIKMFGEKQEKIRSSINGRHSQLKQSDAGCTSVTTANANISCKPMTTKLTNEEIKEKMEQQLKLQRAAHQQKKITDVKQPIVKPNTSTTNRRVIVKNHDGTTRIIHQNISSPTVQSTKVITASNNQNKTTSAVTNIETAPTPQAVQHKVQIIRGPDGKVSVRGLSPGQQLIQMPDGKLHVLTTTQVGAHKNVSLRAPAAVINKSVQNSTTSSTLMKQVTVKPVAKTSLGGLSSKQTVIKEVQQKVQTSSITPAAQVVRNNAPIASQSAHKILTNGGQIVQPSSTTIKTSNLQPLIVQPGQKLLVGQNAHGQKVLISPSSQHTPQQTPVQSSQTLPQTQHQILLSSQPTQKVIQQIVNTSNVQQQIMVGGQRIILSPGQTIVTQRSVPQTPQVQVLQQQIIQPAQHQQQIVVHAQPHVETRATVPKLKVQNQVQNQQIQQTATENVSQPTQQQLVVQNSALAQQLAQGKLQVATVNGQQVIIKPLGNNQAQIVAHIKTQSDGNAHIVTNVNFPDNPKETQTLMKSPKNVHMQKNTLQLNENVSKELKLSTEENRTYTTQEDIQPETSLATIEQNLLHGQPPGTVIKCVTAQVIQTEQGPRIVLQGLVGNDFTQQQLALVQQQVKQQLLKAQESSGKQGVLGPTKIYLAVQPNTAVIQNANVQTPPLPNVQQPHQLQQDPRANNLEGNSNANLSRTTKENNEYTTELNKNQEDKNQIVIRERERQSDVKQLVSNMIFENQAFVITPDYIQQTIKNALKQENLNPDIEEKLINLQKYQERQMKSELITSSPGNSNISLISTSEPLCTSRKRHSKSNEEADITCKSIKPNLFHAGAAKTENSLIINSQSGKPSNENAAINEAERKKNASHIYRLHRQKELLKKDILKKRAILERKLHIEIQKELYSEVPEQQTHHVKSLNFPKANIIEKYSPQERNSEIHSNNKMLFGNKAKKGSRSPIVTKKREKLYCICRTPYDDTKFYVGCDLCSNWFHGECVQITEEASKKLSEFICEECRRARDTQELYCSCKQPYDESQFYICCDKCQDWFHGRCVGIVQSEAEFIDEYICPDCQRNNTVNMANTKSLSTNEYEELNKLIKQVQNHKNSWPFMEPVDPEEAPDYYKVIKEPMDLKKIEKKIDDKMYTKLSEFIGDMTKIFDNCRYYNPKESTFYKCAESLELYFVQKIKNLRENVILKS